MEDNTQREDVFYFGKEDKIVIQIGKGTYMYEFDFGEEITASHVFPLIPDETTVGLVHLGEL